MFTLLIPAGLVHSFGRSAGAIQPIQKKQHLDRIAIWAGRRQSTNRTTPTGFTTGSVRYVQEVDEWSHFARAESTVGKVGMFREKFVDETSYRCIWHDEGWVAHNTDSNLSS